MNTLLLGLVLLSSNAAFAEITLTPACEKKVIKEAIKNKESSLYLDFYVEAITEDLANTIVSVAGSFTDADADYQYLETHEIYLKAGTCQIVAARITDIFED